MMDVERDPIITTAAGIAPGDVIAGYFLHGTGALYTLPAAQTVVSVGGHRMEFGRPSVPITYRSGTAATYGSAVHAASTRMLVLR